MFWKLFWLVSQGYVTSWPFDNRGETSNCHLKTPAPLGWSGRQPKRSDHRRFGHKTRVDMKQLPHLSIDCTLYVSRYGALNTFAPYPRTQSQMGHCILYTQQHFDKYSCGRANKRSFLVWRNRHGSIWIKIQDQCFRSRCPRYRPLPGPQGVHEKKASGQCGNMSRLNAS